MGVYGETASQYLPAGQSAQSSPLRYLPIGQATGALLPAAQYMPAVQVEQPLWEVRPVVAL